MDVVHPVELAGHLAQLLRAHRRAQPSELDGESAALSTDPERLAQLIGVTE